MASDPAGIFVVTWESRYQDGSFLGVFGQRYDSAGAPLGGEFRVNSYTTSDQSQSSVAASTGSSFIVAWASTGQDGDRDGVFAQRFCSSLSAVNVNVSGATTVCSTSMGGTATATDFGGGFNSHQWGYRTVSMGSTTPIGGQTGASYVISGLDFQGAGTYYLVCATFPQCGTFAFSNEIVVTITAGGPTTATAGGPQTICVQGTTAPLGGNTPVVGTGTWSIVTAGVSGTFLPDASTPNATFQHTSGGFGGTILLRWTISDASCSSSADVPVTIRQVTATAGGPQTICATGTTAGLGGNTPTAPATGSWSILTGGASGTFNPGPSAPNATFTHSAGTGTITLRWTVSNPPCAAATADVDITITPPPTTATAGGPQTICAQGTTAGLGGNTPTTGTGSWTVVSGGTGSFNPDASTPSATFTHTGGAGPVTLRWAISNPPCAPSTADVVVTIQPQLSSVMIDLSGSMTVCTTGTAGTLSVTDSGGGALTHQWGYRTTSGGMATPIFGKTGPAYLIDGTDFPGAGFYYVVCYTTPTCGTPMFSNEIVIVVTTDTSAPSVTPPPDATVTQTICM